jgi:chaperonin GroES
MALTINEILKSDNVAELLEKKELESISHKVYEGFTVDLNSRLDWERRTEESMKLALQVAETKSFPWPGASNVRFPLITIAALQYHARAYPALMQSSTPIQCRRPAFSAEMANSAPQQPPMPMGGMGGPGGAPQPPQAPKTVPVTSRAERIENHMSWQILEQDENWEEEFDRVLITQPIIGTAFKKTYHDPIKGYNVSENILAKDLVVNYWTKDLDSAPRVTQILYMSKNDIYERVARGLWSEMEEVAPNTPATSNLTSAHDRAQGITAPQSNDPSTPYEILEQHTWLDLDDDGYEEPYIVYLRRDTRQILRVVARFVRGSVHKKNDKILSIKPESYFTKFPFIPSPDGGFYDLGFGVLLGPLNQSIDTLINQLIDAGTMANTAGGFIARGVKIRGGNTSFAPLEWKPVDSTGDDLRKGVFPLPVRDPSQVLFTLLSLLINYGERIGGSVDILVGQNPGQNTPAETSRTMAEQGMKIFSGIFKRTYRSLKKEFRKLYRLNQFYVTELTEFGGGGMLNYVKPEDYQKGDSSDVAPSADPNIISDAQRMQQAQAMLQLASTTPGVNLHEAQIRYAKALKVPDIDRILPDPNGPDAIPPMPNPKIQVENIKAQVKQADTQLKFKLGMMKIMKDAETKQAQIHKLEAEAMKAIADAKGVQTGHAIAAMNTEIAAAKHRQDGLLKAIETMMKVSDSMSQDNQQENAPTMGETSVP